MSYPFSSTLALCVGAVLIFAASSTLLQADDAVDLKRQVGELLEQNKALQKTVSQQQGVIENLNRRMGDIERRPSQTQEITVPAEGEVKINFTLGIRDLPEY